jgi:hypothetical protein
MRTSISGAGHVMGVPITPASTELQWPAVRTVSGAISVPVQEKIP